MNESVKVVGYCADEDCSVTNVYLEGEYAADGVGQIFWKDGSRIMGMVGLLEKDFSEEWDLATTEHFDKLIKNTQCEDLVQLPICVIELQGGKKVIFTSDEMTTKGFILDGQNKEDIKPLEGLTVYEVTEDDDDYDEMELYLY